MEGVIEVDKPIALRCRAGELQARFDRLGTGVGEDNGVETGICAAGTFGQPFGEEAGKERAVHLDQIRAIEVEKVMEGPLQDQVLRPSW
jgi:hypothetical protein